MSDWRTIYQQAQARARSATASVKLPTPTPTDDPVQAGKRLAQQFASSEDPSLGEQARDLASGVVGGAVSVPADILYGAGQVLGSDSLRGAAEKVSQFGEGLIGPSNPYRQTLAGDVGHFIGGSAPYLAAGAAPMSLPAWARMAGLGATAGFGSGAREANQAGATTGQAIASGLGQAAIGAGMAFPAERILGAASRPFLESAPGVLAANTGYGAAAQLAGNILRQQTYAPETDTTEGVGKAALAAGLGGAALHAGVQAITPRPGERGTSTAPPVSLDTPPENWTPPEKSQRGWADLTANEQKAWTSAGQEMSGGRDVEFHQPRTPEQAAAKDLVAPKGTDVLFVSAKDGKRLPQQGAYHLDPETGRSTIVIDTNATDNAILRKALFWHEVLHQLQTESPERSEKLWQRMQSEDQSLPDDQQMLGVVAKRLGKAPEEVTPSELRSEGLSYKAEQLATWLHVHLTDPALAEQLLSSRQAPIMDAVDAVLKTVQSFGLMKDTKLFSQRYAEKLGQIALTDERGMDAKVASKQAGILAEGLRDYLSADPEKTYLPAVPGEKPAQAEPVAEAKPAETPALQGAADVRNPQVGQLFRFKNRIWSVTYVDDKRVRLINADGEKLVRSRPVFEVAFKPHIVEAPVERPAQVEPSAEEVAQLMKDAAPEAGTEPQEPQAAQEGPPAETEAQAEPVVKEVEVKAPAKPEPKAHTKVAEVEGGYKGKTLVNPATGEKVRVARELDKIVITEDGRRIFKKSIAGKKWVVEGEEQSKPVEVVKAKLDTSLDTDIETAVDRHFKGLGDTDQELSDRKAFAKNVYGMLAQKPHEMVSLSDLGAAFGLVQSQRPETSSEYQQIASEILRRKVTSQEAQALSDLADRLGKDPLDITPKEFREELDRLEVESSTQTMGSERTDEGETAVRDTSPTENVPMSPRQLSELMREARATFDALAAEGVLKAGTRKRPDGELEYYYGTKEAVLPEDMQRRQAKRARTLEVQEARSARETEQDSEIHQAMTEAREAQVTRLEENMKLVGMLKDTGSGVKGTTPLNQRIYSDGARFIRDGLGDAMDFIEGRADTGISNYKTNFEAARVETDNHSLELWEQKAKEARDAGKEEPPMPEDVLFFSRARETPWAGERFKLTDEDRLEMLHRQLVDKFSIPRRVLRQVLSQGGAVSEKADFDMALTNSPGATASRLRELEHGIVDPYMAAIKKHGMTLDEAGNYLYALHAERRNTEGAKRDLEERQGRENARAARKGVKPQKLTPDFDHETHPYSGMRTSEAQQIMADMGKKYTQDQLDEIRDWNRKLQDSRLKLAVDYGFLNQRDAAEMRNRWGQDYVPLRDVGDRNPKGLAYKAKGRSTLAQWPIAFSVDQYKRMIVAGEKNRVYRSVAEFVRENPDSRLWHIVTAQDKIPIKYREQALQYWNHGRRRWVVFADPAMARDLMNQSVYRTDAVTRFVGRWSRVFARLSTTWNPEFLLPNVTRDLQAATLNLSSEGKGQMVKRLHKDIVPAARAMWNVQKNPEHAGKMEDMARRFRRAGGEFGGAYVEELPQLMKSLEAKVNDVKRKNYGPRKLWDVAKSFGEVIERAGGSLENGTRLAIFKAAVESGMSDAKAAQLAKTATVDFNRGGQASPFLNAWYTFFNANVQGTVRTFSGFHKSKAKMAFAGSLVAFGAMQGLLNRVLSDVDEDGVSYWDKKSGWEKSRELILMLPGGKGRSINLPLPWGWALFNSLGTQIDSIAHGQSSKSKFAAALWNGAMDSFNPMGSSPSLLQFVTPTLFDPLAQIAENKDFAGRPIAPAEDPFAHPPKPNSERFFRTVSPTALKTARALNALSGGSILEPGAVDLSPEWIELAGNQVLGGAGMAANKLLRSTEDALAGKFNLNNTPILRRFSRGLDEDRQIRSDYYQRMNDVLLAEEKVKSLQDQEARGSPDYAARIALEQAQRRIRAMRTQQNRTQDPAQRDRLEQQIVATMKRFNVRYMELQRR